MDVRTLTVDEARAQPNMLALLGEYADESAIAGLGPAAPQWDTYLAMEAAGFVRVLGAMHEGALVGFLVLLTGVLPHFGAFTGSTESYFVAAEYRHTGAGLALFREAKRIATELGCSGFFVSAPADSKLSVVLAGLHMAKTNEVFFTPL